MLILSKTRIIFSFARKYYTVSTKTSKKKFDVAKHLYSKIKTTGPITIADYMKDVLVAPDHGYYMTKDVFGETGDFVTSPELGQIFGEMVAIWFLNEWSKMGSPKPFQIVELGPGRGTLCQDILKVFDHFKSLKSASVELVEISPYLCDLQARRLCPQTNVASKEDSLVYREGNTINGTPVRWYRHLNDVPNIFTLLVAHEFFDALPIHKLKRVGNKYREILVDIVDNKEDSFRYVMSSKDTVASKLYVDKNETREHVEISPESLNLMKEISKRITSDGGLALIVDYGHEGESKDTFRAFSKHKQVDPLVMPGTSDLTADVDFAALKGAAIASGDVLTFGPVTQRDFLLRMGIEHRVNKLKEFCQTEDEKTALAYGYKMMTDMEQMGSKFKFLGILPATLKAILDKAPVVGFH